jgi:L,D-transpeptidase catalytic domain
MIRLMVTLGFVALIFQCTQTSNQKAVTSETDDTVNRFNADTIGINKRSGVLFRTAIGRNVNVKSYFSFVDSIATAVDTFRNWSLNDYALVHANPWILDSLKNTDYYIQREKGNFLFDQSAKIVLHKNDSISIPDSTWSAQIMAKIDSTFIDINIPEFRLRIFQLGDTVMDTKVRVGQNKKKYLDLAGHEVDLRTPIGKGEIIRIEKKPLVINPETGKRYEGTNRDDGGYTKMPIIPWLEPSINGIRYGTMIHPITNPKTLGSPSSHGCIGTSEADAWVIYYNAPLGTEVNFRYDLKVLGDNGDTVVLKDIYNLRKQRR